jgi:hypothetical protein
MFKNKKLVSGLVSKIAKAERETLLALGASRIQQEPSVTDRLLGTMEHALNGTKIGGLTWTAKTLTDRGRGSEEHEFGADFAAVFRVRTPEFTIAKGFLAQAKLLEPSGSFGSAEAARLKKQCQSMLEHSAASYVFLYSQQVGIVIVPACEVVGARACNPHELTTRSMRAFYTDHFDCFIGDMAISSADNKGLAELRERRNARRLFLLSGAALVGHASSDERVEYDF